MSKSSGGLRSLAKTGGKRSPCSMQDSTILRVNPWAISAASVMVLPSATKPCTSALVGALALQSGLACGDPKRIESRLLRCVRPWKTAHRAKSSPVCATQTFSPLSLMLPQSIPRRRADQSQPRPGAAMIPNLSPQAGHLSRLRENPSEKARFPRPRAETAPIVV